MTNNRYDSLFGNRAAPDARSSRAAELASKYDSIIPDQDARRAQINVLPDNNPDVAARANKYERSFGVPAAVAQDEISNYDAMARQRRVAAVAAEHPNVGRFLADPRAAAVAHDDTSTLAAISKQFKSFWDAKPAAQPKSFLQRARDIPSNIAGAVGAGVFGLAEGVTQGLRALGEVRDQIDPVALIYNAMSDATPEQRRAADRGNVLKPLIATQRAEAKRLRPTDGGFVEQSLYQGIESVPSSVAALGAGLLGAPAAGLGLLGLSTGGQSYGQARDAGKAPLDAAYFGAAQAGVEVLTEAVPVLNFLKDTKVGTPFFKRLAKNMGAEQVGEQTATALQDFNEWALLDQSKGKTFGEYLKERPEAAARTALAVAATVGSTNVAIAGAEKTVDVVNRVMDARRGAATLDGIMTQAANSKLRGRDPEAFRQFVEQAAENHPAEHVYLPAEAVETYMQSEGFADEDGFFEGLRDQLDEARATGGDVVVPLSDVASRLAGTPAWEALKDDARLSAGGLSLRQSVTEGAEITKAIEARGEEIATAARDEAEAAEPAVAVYEEVRDQLKAAGFTQGAAEKQAQLFAASREAWGKRLGMTAQEYHAANPVEFKRGSMDTSGAQRTLDQSYRDIDFSIPGTEGAAHNGYRIWQNGAAEIDYEISRDPDVPIKLDLLHVEPRARRAGAGRSAMEQFLAQADAQGRTVALTAEPIGDGRKASKTALVKFYKSLGFRENTGPGRNFSTRETMIREPQPVNKYDQGARGQIALYGDRSVITLFETADLSTLIHETGHLFLEELQKNAALPNAPADVVADWESVKAWFAENGHPVREPQSVTLNQNGDETSPTPGNIPREAHELWARGFERYAMEGKAPSSALQGAFTAFRGWLLRIYEVVSRLRAPITPEVRQVMDRMLATQEAIDAYADEQNAKALFTDAAQADMTEAEFDAYQATVNQSRNDAFDALLFRTMAKIKQQRERAYRETSRTIRDEATTAISDQPRFRALRLLRTGRIDDREMPVRLDREWLKERYGDDAEARLPVNIRIAGSDATNADDVAALTGFASGAEMMDALFDIGDQTRTMRALGDKRQLRDRLIDEAVEAAVVDQGLKDPLTDGSIEEEAIAAINNDRQGEVIASESRALARRTRGAATPYRLAREWAKRKVEAGRVNDVASRAAMQRYARAAAKASRLAEGAMLEGNVDEAFRQKQAQMLNHALLVEAKAAADEIDTVVARMNKLAKRAAMQSVDQDYFDRVHALLEGYSFRAASQKGLDELEGFRAWAEQRAAAGFEVFVPARLAIDQQHYSRVTVEELFGVRDAVDSLMALGRHKQKLLDGQKERDFAEVVNAIVANGRQLPTRSLPKKSFNEDTKRRGLRDVVAGGLKISTIALDLDVQNQNGPMMNLLVHRATEAENKRANLRDLVLTPLAQRYVDMTAKEQRRLEELVMLPELSFNVGLGEDDPRLGQPVTVTRKELLAIALNTGNLSNLEKMTKGERWNPTALREALNRELTAGDWQFVQAMWDGVERLWPSIVETERALSGVVPEKVTPLAAETPHGIFAGGYWPVVYDSDRSGVAEKNADKSADDLFGKRAGLSTPKGHTIARTEATGPMTYSLDHILMNHVEKVITRVSYAEYARDVMRVVGDDRVKGIIDLKLGKEYRRQIQPWLQRQITSYVNLDGAKFMERVLRYTRQGITVVGMGLRFSTGVAQVSGLMNSVARLGGTQTLPLVNNMRRTLMGIPAMMAGGASETHEFVFSRSEQMRRRLRESSVETDSAFRKLAGKHNYRDTVAAWSMWHIGMVDLHIVAIPTWLTAHAKAVNEGMTDKEAANYADQMVVTSQGGGRAKDLSAWQAPGSEAQKLFVMFYTPFNVLFNAQWEAARGVKRGDYAKAANLTFFFLVAQMLADALLSGDWPKEDKEDPEGMPLATIKWAARNVGFGMFSGIPFARDAATFGERSMIGQYASFGGTPIARTFEDMTRSASTLYKVQQGEKDFEPQAVPGLANAIGAATHTPLGQPGSTAKFLWQYKRGEVEPQSIADWYQGLTKGKMAKDEKR
ncbi:MAG TPA: hypothetical protein VF638_14350 [Sphingomonas sp.]